MSAEPETFTPEEIRAGVREAAPVMLALFVLVIAAIGLALLGAADPEAPDLGCPRTQLVSFNPTDFAR